MRTTVPAAPVPLVPVPVPVEEPAPVDEPLAPVPVELVPLALVSQLQEYALVAAPLYILLGEALAVSGLACLIACVLGLVLGGGLAVARFPGRGGVITAHGCRNPGAIARW